jgi:hypothetical protein
LIDPHVRFTGIVALRAQDHRHILVSSATCVGRG